jgi:hypothetical protein
MADLDREHRAALAAQGRGAWRDLAGGRDLVGELLAARRLEAAADEAAERGDTGAFDFVADILRRR